MTTSPRTTQCGVALVLSLIVLAVLSVLGISAMRMSVGELQIAGDTENTNRSFQAAEAGITAGLDLIVNDPSNLSFTQGSNLIDFSAVSPNPVAHLGDDAPAVTIRISGDPDGTCARSEDASSADLVGCGAFELSSTHAADSATLLKDGATTVLRKGVTQQVIKQN
jgi:hypothetical protein